MIENFLFIGLPYIALAVMLGGSIYRYQAQRFTYSALGSQFLESNQLRWGSMAWHLGILILLVGHLIPFLLPGLWQALVSVPDHDGRGGRWRRRRLALIGLAVLRRRVSRQGVRGDSTADFVLLALLIAQVLVGIAVGHWRAL